MRAVNGLKWLEWLEMDGNCWNGWTWLERAGITGYGWKWPNIARIAGNKWNWLEIAAMNEMAIHGKKWIEWLEMAEMV